ncbi:MAG: bifunctional 4-hydroxy-2-oxoglutarate aldolase/2-dehydro-3-deoxy-phosphogluconate aldolase [Lachnospiraceae bacterium]|nr:bifunctional 4-hydroxy-2-oxoglutarate aldolase/2-dehydro-3-deoxy-phosphogluconate aldolase [Lachnospiraceae bacterium]
MRTLTIGKIALSVSGKTRHLRAAKSVSVQLRFAGGLPCAEVTFRTAAAEESIKIMAEAFPEMLVGAGTVLTIEQADRAIAAGAKFIVSPGFNEKIVKHCLEKGVPMVPGINNPTGIEAALELGLDTVKFFPAEASGGIEMIKAMAAPYTAVKFMPTGGINAKNICDYLAFDKIIACGGSWMVKKDLVAAGKFDEIRALTEEAVRLMLGFNLKHIGINCDGEDEAVGITNHFDELFGFTTKIGNSSVFAGSFVEAMKSKGRGVHGHIAIGTNSVARARHYLETVKGVKFIEESASYKGDKLNAIYLEGELGGFAVHLVNNK